MCGIAGILNLYRTQEISIDILRNMTAVVRHRGPDGYGFYRDERVGLAHARLSVIDLKGGAQPIHNEDKTLWIICNGEIFNHIELRASLEKKGHTFSTGSDAEVIVHAYEEYGPECLHHLNGQFAFGLWDKREQELFIARDRVGIRPLFYTLLNGQLLFASEIKSLFVDRRVRRRIDPYALDQIFTFWMTIPPRTAFSDVFELPAGHCLKVKKGRMDIEQYWEPDFSSVPDAKTAEEYAEQLRALLIDATKLQLRADVPVGAYLSGGIDSSTITALVKKYTDTPLRTFSVTFADGEYDESAYQQQMVDHLHADHSGIACTCSDIGRIFPEVIWHTEKPVVRTAPAPLYLLSKLVRESGYKVVLTGEGADEILAGYDIFKEMKARRFLDNCPGSTMRPLILKRLYPYLAASPVRSVAYAETFFASGISRYPADYYSHIPRWNTTSMVKTFFSGHLKDVLGNYNSTDELSFFLSCDLSRRDGLSQAQYIEMKTLLPGYLLSSQGDRVAMAHSIEGRFPFLDHRVVDFCCKLPPAMKMRALTEKYVLKKSMKGLLPPSVIKRAKQPYRAPDAKSFFHDGSPGYVEELLSKKNLEETGYFDPKTVSLLVKKCAERSVLGFKDNMAIVGILSTLLLHDLFVKKFDSRNAVEEGAKGGACAVKA